MTSIREQIVDAVATALEEISIANGYDNDISGGVQRFRQQGATLATPPAIHVAFDNEQKELRESNMYDCTLSVEIELLAVDPADSGNVSATYLDSLATDVERCLATELDLAGLAVDWSVSSLNHHSLVEGQPYVGFTVTLEVRYRHDASDPRIVR